jgi:hypothetical protein
MAEELEKLILEKEKLQQKFDLINEKNKELRHKAGQVFLQSLESGGFITKQSVGKSAGKEKIYLEDEEAIIRMMNEIDL